MSLLILQKKKEELLVSQLPWLANKHSFLSPENYKNLKVISILFFLSVIPHLSMCYIIFSMSQSTEQSNSHLHIYHAFKNNIKHRQLMLHRIITDKYYKMSIWRTEKLLVRDSLFFVKLPKCYLQNLSVLEYLCIHNFAR